MTEKKEPMLQRVQHKELQQVQYKDLKKKIEELEKHKQEYLAGWQRARADFLNYKKEQHQRNQELLEYGKEKFVLKILPILDNIYIAEKRIPAELKNNQWIEGFSKIKKQFENFLKEQGIEEIKSLGEKFDPNFHEAVEEIETKDKESGIIVDVVCKGYIIGDRVIRVARVKIVK